MRTVAKKCPMCGHTWQMLLSDEEEARYMSYVDSNTLVQEMLPEFNPVEREFLDKRSGYCPECQKLLFGTRYTSGRIMKAEEDSDDEPSLPKQLTIKLSDIPNYEGNEDEDALDDIVVDYISDLYGFLIFGINRAYMDNTVEVTDICWDISDN